MARPESVFLVLELRMKASGSRRRPELEHAFSVEDDEDLLLGGVAMRRRRAPARVEPDPVQAASLRPRKPADLDERPALLDLRRRDVGDVRRTGARRRRFGFPGSGLPLPRM